MSVCRTCLSKNDLNPIFPDKNLVVLRSQQLHMVCGIKIEPDDGYSQLICDNCTNLVNGALKLREQSKNAEEIFKNTLIIKIEPENRYNNKQREIKEPQTKYEIGNSKIELEKQKKVFNKKSSDTEFQYEYTVRIEDFESSNDSDFMNDFLSFNKNFDTLRSDDENRKVCIEDFESSDSFEYEFESIIKREPFEVRRISYDAREKELLDRERRKMLCKEQDEKLLSLAMTPYDVTGPIKCTICSKVLRNVQNFKSHAKTHFELKNACEECGKKFLNPSHMRYHQQRIHGRTKRLACTKCHYRAVDQLQLQNHERAEHTGERPYICDVCGDSFRMRANITQHMRKHFGVRNFQCERCPAMFRSRSELTGHQNRVHNLIYTYFCYLCPETYKRPASVKKHIANVHGVPSSQQLSIKCVKSRKS